MVRLSVSGLALTVAAAVGAVLLSPLGAAAAPTRLPAAAVVPGPPTITTVVAGPVGGQLVVSYAAPASDGGAPITSYDASIDGGVTWWTCAPQPGSCTLTSLVNGRTYAVALRAVNAVGPGPASAPVSGVPVLPAGSDPDKPVPLPKPRATVTATFNAASNSLGVDGSRVRLGVGTLPKLTFSRAITDKRVAETHLKVMATLADGQQRAVPGAWGWVDDRSAVFRPKKWWPGRATITITSTMDGAVLGRSGSVYLVGAKSLATTYTFRTARKLIAKVDGSRVRMKVFIDDVLVKSFPVSLGKDEWETREGVKVISAAKEPTHTYTSTALGLDESEESYVLEDIPWNTRLTPTGEFIHSAPWAYGRIGRYNGSHGCTNMFEKDAKWIYDRTIPGDVVVYTNTGGEPVQSWNGPGGLWNIPWAQWLKKSALGSVTGNPDVADPTAPQPGDDTTPVGA